MTTLSEGASSRPDAPEGSPGVLPDPVLGAAGGSPRRTGRNLLVALVAMAVAAGLLALLYVASVHATPGDSDGATVALEGLAFTQGHLLLHGWTLSLDSFWTVDAPLYFVAVGIGGVTLGLLHFVPALIAVLVIGVGAYMAADGNYGKGAVVGPLVVVALLGFPTHSMAFFFLRGPLHVCTALWALIAFLAIRRGRFGWGFLVAVLFLAAGMLGDLQEVALGVTPIGIAGVVAMLRTRSIRSGIVQVTAAVSSVVLMVVVRETVKRLGAFRIAPANPHAGFHQMLHNVRTAVTETAQLFGVTSRDFGTGGVPNWLQDVHVVGLALVCLTGLTALVALVAGALRGQGTRGGWPLSAMVRAERPSASSLSPSRRARSGAVAPTPEPWRLDDMLTVACFAPPVAFVILSITNTPPFGRYLTDGVIYSSILAARLVGRWAGTASFSGIRRYLGSAAAVLALAVAAAFAAGTAYTIAQPAPVQPASRLALFLERHHLYEGLGAYWTASITTVASDNRVKIRPVVAKHGRLVRYDRQSAADWYAGVKFRFVAYNLQSVWGGVVYKTAVKTFGTPSDVYDVVPYQVLVWARPITVSAAARVP
jgi:hypothetical protein